MAISVLSVFILSLLGCAARPDPRRWLFFIPIALFTAHHIFSTSTADAFSSYPVNLTLALNFFVMSDFLVLTDVQNVLRKKGQVESISRASLQERLHWAFDLITAYRGVGWNHEPTTHLAIPSKPSPTRRQFFLNQLLVLGKLCLCYTVCEIALEIHPSFAKGGPPFSAQVWWLRPVVLAQGLGNMASMGIVYWVLGMLFVGSGYSEPSEWPPLYGHFSEMYSVRYFWGRVWHQAFRRFLTTHGNFLVNKLGITNRLARLCLKVWVAFFLSSLVHFIGGDWAVCGWSGGSLLFFNLQPLAIGAEMSLDYALRQFRICAPAALRHGVGYLWVILWFTLTFPICVEPLVQAGFLEHRGRLPVLSFVSRPLEGWLGDHFVGGT